MSGEAAAPADRGWRRPALIALLYAAFAVLATAVNLGVQAVLLLSGAAVLVALAAGTIAGLPVKYVLDKRYIFRFHTDRLAHDGPLFVKYTAMALATTLIFWVVEWVTHHLTDDTGLTLVGGAIGLVIGYSVKYSLDAKYVFVVDDVEVQR